VSLIEFVKRKHYTKQIMCSNWYLKHQQQQPAAAAAYRLTPIPSMLLKQQFVF